MKDRTKFDLLHKIDDIIGEDNEDTYLLKKMHLEAKEYLLSFKWCLCIKEEYYGFGIGGVIAVFFFKIEPLNEEIDEWLWVVTGDIPPAYIDTFNCNNCFQALFNYVEIMNEWVKAIKNNNSVDERLPVNVPPTIEWANNLELRLKFIEDEILFFYKDYL